MELNHYNEQSPVEFRPSKNVVRVMQTKVYEWTPQEDITAYELALALPIIMTQWATNPEIPDVIARHFTLMPDEKR